MNIPDRYSEQMLLVELADVSRTLAFGAALGKVLSMLQQKGNPVRAVMLFGDLGSGKTTLTRGIVGSLPGGTDAEVCSPSFTVCNEYATHPSVVHCDLYRDDDDGAAGLPDEAWELLERDSSSLVLVEWAQRLRSADLLPERLDILLESCHEKHVATLTAHGAAARQVIEELICSGWGSPQGMR